MHNFIIIPSKHNTGVWNSIGDMERGAWYLEDCGAWAYYCGPSMIQKMKDIVWVFSLQSVHTKRKLAWPHLKLKDNTIVPLYYREFP